MRSRAVSGVFPMFFAVAAATAFTVLLGQLLVMNSGSGSFPIKQ
jgi:hypothetical protein